MPTMTGSIWAQNIGFRIVSGEKIDTVTLNFNNRDITAEAALTLLSHGKKSIWVECGFSSVTSNGQTEEFDPPLPRLLRTGVTSITFRTATYNCQVRSRWAINVWE
ncbi:hypothetical protein [Flexithrix dorotheae]|uniref:hypothetical protein n=1 Tax=Flexithrix dorotheae TaxID=70993 RepID=UPI0003AA66B2|nr:hypothetical protein [Flexithrix dorotheae]